MKSWDLGFRPASANPVTLRILEKRVMWPGWTARRLGLGNRPLAAVAAIALALIAWQMDGGARIYWRGRVPHFRAAVEPPKVPEHLQPPAFGDPYGGAPVHVQKGTGFFTVAKVGKRWVFVTPQGNAFWMRAVYHGIEGSLEPKVIQQKYRGDVDLWATQRNRRLLSWGFNTLGEYTAQRGLPIGVWGGAGGNAVKLPFIIIINALMYGETTPGRLGMKDPLKDIVKGVPQSTFDSYRGSLGDMYDPHLSDAFRGQIAEETRPYTGGFASQSWVLGITPDDADFLFGLKTNGSGAVVQHPHPVFLIATTKFDYTSAEDSQGRNYRDHKLYSKYAWVEFLKSKYGTIEALNGAWDSNYSSFDDDGGYGEGHGLLDEDGRHRAWLGSDAFLLADAKPAVRSDMDAFLYQFARRYAEVAVKAIRAVDRNHLIFSPACINSEGYEDREQVLRGFADGGIDVFCVGFNAVKPDLSGNRQTYEVTGKPQFAWYAVNAARDSGMHDFKPGYGDHNFASQEERGAAYARDLLDFYDVTSKDGDHFIAGIDFWELVDNPSEKTNFGLLSRKDNAYDGREAVQAKGKDPWGFTTGGEDRNYGDFLSTVRNTNFEIQERLTRDLAPYGQKTGKNKK